MEISQNFVSTLKSKGSKHDLMGGGQNQKGFVLNMEDFSIEQLKRDDKISGKKLIHKYSSLKANRADLTKML